VDLLRVCNWAWQHPRGTPAGGQLCFGGLRAGWLVLQGAWGLVADRLAPRGAGRSEAGGEEMCPRLPAQLVSSSNLILFFPALLWIAPKPSHCSFNSQRLPAVRSHGGDAEPLRELGRVCRRGLCPVPRVLPCQGTDRPRVHSPDVKDQELLLLQAALHHGVCVSVPAACKREHRSPHGAQLWQLPTIPPQCRRRKGQRGW